MPHTCEASLGMKCKHSTPSSLDAVRTSRVNLNPKNEWPCAPVCKATRTGSMLGGLSPLESNGRTRSGIVAEIIFAASDRLRNSHDKQMTNK